MLDARLEIQNAVRSWGGPDRGMKLIGAGSTMPVFTGWVGAPLKGASNFEVVNRMGVRDAATGSLSPVSGASAANLSAIFSKSFNFVAENCGAISLARVAIPAVHDDHRFAECAAPRTVRLALGAGRSTPPKAADSMRFSLRKQRDAQETVRETLVSHETGGW